MNKFTKHLTIQDWINSGYKRFEQVKHIKPYAEFGLQKLVSDQTGKRYFITVFVYDNRRFKSDGKLPIDYQDYSFEPDIQFADSSKCQPIVPCLSLILHKGATVEGVERLVDKHWLASNMP